MRHSGYPPRSTQISSRDHLEQQVERRFSCSAFEQACEYFLCGNILRVLLTQAAAHLGRLLWGEPQRTFVLLFYESNHARDVLLTLLWPVQYALKHIFYFLTCHVASISRSVFGRIMGSCTLIGRMMIVALPISRRRTRAASATCSAYARGIVASTSTLSAKRVWVNRPCSKIWLYRTSKMARASPSSILMARLPSDSL